MKYIELYNELKSAIESGLFPAGGRIPNTRVLMEEKSLSLATVVKAVKMLEAEGLIKRVKSKGTFVLEKGVAGLASLKAAARIAFIFEGFLSKNLEAHFFLQALQGVENVCQKYGKSLVPMGTENKGVETLLTEIRTAGIGGVIFYSMHSNPIFQYLKTMKIPFVYCEYIDFRLNADQFTTDHLKAGSLALSRLLELGHKEIVFWGNYKLAQRRNETYHQYWWHAVQAEAELKNFSGLSSAFIHRQTDREAMKIPAARVLEKHPEATGHICSSTTYFNLVREFVESGRFLKDKTVDVVLFADWHEKKTISGRPVLQCRWDTREMGALAAERLFQILKGGPHKTTIHYVPVEILHFPE